MVETSVYLVDQIAKCQAAICVANETLCGFVGAAPIALLEVRTPLHALLRALLLAALRLDRDLACGLA